MLDAGWKKLGMAALTVPAMMLAGCMSTMAPKMPKELAAPAMATYSQTDFNADVAAYRTAIRAKDLPTARTLRDQIAYRVMADIETVYGGFEVRLTTQRAGFATGADAMQLGLTAATAVVGAGDVKDILAATLSAVQGTRLSVDKNFFQEKTTEALISQMRASRKEKQAQLILSLGTRDVQSYPLEAAWMDLVDFYYAGSVPSALVEIASTAGAKAEVGSATLKDAITQMTPVKQSIGNRTAYTKLKANVDSGDPTKVASATASLRSILTATGYAPKADATGNELLALYLKALGDTDPDVDTTGAKLKALTAAVAAANIE